MSEFKYFRCAFTESGTDEAECHRKVLSGRRIAGAISLILHESLLMPVLMHGSETMIWKEKE